MKKYNLLISVYVFVISLLVLYLICLINTTSNAMLYYVFGGFSLTYFIFWIVSLFFIKLEKWNLNYFSYLFLSIMGNILLKLFGRYGFEYLTFKMVLESMLYLNFPILISTVIVFIFIHKQSNSQVK